MPLNDTESNLDNSSEGELPRAFSCEKQEVPSPL